MNRKQLNRNLRNFTPEEDVEYRLQKSKAEMMEGCSGCMGCCSGYLLLLAILFLIAWIYSWFI